MPHYPGAGAGGHCIPKDPRFLLSSAKKFGTSFNSIESALEINFKMHKYICDSIENILEENHLEKSVLVCGLSYKANVEDMRDSPSFKIINELKTRNFKVFGYDPFFKMELIDKYLKENNKTEMNFEILENLSNESLQNINCICIVQHHEQVKTRLNEIYEKNLVPVIYDCQSRIISNKNSSTILKSFG